MRHNTNFNNIEDFARTFDVAPAWKDNHRVDVDILNLRLRLIEEEVLYELVPAVEKLQKSSTLENLVPVADGIVDSVYVLLGLAVALDLPWDELWREVHNSNMAKIHADGTVHRREDGKILKPDGWTPPDIYKILLAWQEARVKKDQPGRGY